MDRFADDLNRDTLVSLEPAAQSGSRERTFAAGPPPVPTHRPPAARPGVSRVERWLLRRTLRWLGDLPVAVVLWNEEEFTTSSGSCIARIRILDRRTLWTLIADPMFQFGEAYTEGRIEIAGDLRELMLIVGRCFARNRFHTSRPRGMPKRLSTPRRNTLSKSRRNVRHHYDIGNDFYRLWLDEQLIYTCAYFEEPGMTLEQAQAAKMDHVCRKLWLRPGETVIEAGCGWGALALHMARRYGVTVRACNISREQIDYARRRARDEGVADRVEFLEEDWRNLHGTCDVFVSVGMLEHVGRQNYGLLGDVIHRCLKPEGRGLIHSIGQNWPRPFDRWTERRIFPGAYPPALSELAPIFETHDFAILDVENLRLHYAATLRHWLERFERSADAVRDMFDERFVRMWRLYLAASAAAFEGGTLQLFQLVFNRGSDNGIPRTRAHQYAHVPRDAAAHGQSAGVELWNTATF